MYHPESWMNSRKTNKISREAAWRARFILGQKNSRGFWFDPYLQQVRTSHNKKEWTQL